MEKVITPYFTVDDADRLIGFLTAVVGGVIVREVRGADGAVSHARVRIGRSLVMLNQAGEGCPANVPQMHIEVADGEATCQAALTEGARSLMTPNRRPHGALMAGIEDPCGNVWWIASET